MSKEQTLGQKLVRLGVDPSESELVREIKEKSAALIDLCDQQLKSKDGRWAAQAITNFELAAMYAEKAATATA